MSKSIRISEEAHEELKKHSDSKRTSFSASILNLLDMLGKPKQCNHEAGICFESNHQ